VIGCQYATPDDFRSYHDNQTLTLNRNYLDGVSITHGHPRRLIWTVAAAVDAVHAGRGVCPCTKTDTTYADWSCTSISGE